MVNNNRASFVFPCLSAPAIMQKNHTLEGNTNRKFYRSDPVTLAKVGNIISFRTGQKDETLFHLCPCHMEKINHRRGYVRFFIFDPVTMVKNNKASFALPCLSAPAIMQKNHSLEGFLQSNRVILRDAAILFLTRSQ